MTVREAGARYVDFVVPGLLGMNLMGSGIWGLGFAIVDARRKHLLKRLAATPMSRPQFLASFVLSRLTFLIVEVALLVGFAVIVFGVPIRGSLLVPGRDLPAVAPSHSRRSGCSSPRGPARSKGCPAS